MRLTSDRRLALVRILLAPRTAWQAWQVMRREPRALSFDAAWRRARIRAHPEEAPYLMHGHMAERPSEEAT